MTRREIRKHIFKLLFEVEFRDKDEMCELIGIYLDLLDDVTLENSTYITQKTLNICEQIQILDEEINKVAVGWKTSRMNKVDLTILRLALYEIKFDEDIPNKVAVNEAVELSKEYSTEESSAFVNGILASLVQKNSKKTETEV